MYKSLACVRTGLLNFVTIPIILAVTLKKRALCPERDVTCGLQPTVIISQMILGQYLNTMWKNFVF